MKKEFWNTEEGRGAYLYIIENDALKVAATNYGAALVSIIDKKTGIDILLGFDSVEGYMHQHGSHLGGFIGRTANRTKNAAFVLNGNEYHITANENGNNLHGGEGFDRRMYDAEETDHSIIFHRISPDGEEGYPGALDVTVCYELNGDTLTIRGTGKALDQDTLFAFTNHDYYNLNGSGTILNHEMKINASLYAKDYPDGISYDQFDSVAGTPFDFRTFKKIEKDINDPDSQIQANRGYDHHFVADGKGMRQFAVCRGDKLELEVSSDFPGMHVYTANFLDEPGGKNGRHYLPHEAVCFEPEYLPNAVNYPSVTEKPIVRKGETSVHEIKLKLHAR